MRYYPIILILFFGFACTQDKASSDGQQSEAVSSNPFLQLDQMDEQDQASTAGDMTDLKVKMFGETFENEDSLPLPLRIEMYQIKQEAYERIHTSIREFVVRAHLSGDRFNPPEIRDLRDPPEDAYEQAVALYESQKDLIPEGINPQDIIRELEQNIIINSYVEFFSRQIREIESNNELHIQLRPPLIPSEIDFRLTENPSIGESDVPYQIIMFSNYSCTNCRHNNLEMSRLLREYGEQVEFNLILLAEKQGSLDDFATQLGQCIYRESANHFWRYHVRLINREDFSILARSTDGAEIRQFRDQALSSLRDQGLQDKSIDNIEECLISDIMVDHVELMRALYTQLNYQEFPKYIINRRAWNISGSGIYADFENLMDLSQ